MINAAKINVQQRIIGENIEKVICRTIGNRYEFVGLQSGIVYFSFRNEKEMREKTTALVLGLSDEVEFTRSKRVRITKEDNRLLAEMACGE